MTEAVIHRYGSGPGAVRGALATRRRSARHGGDHPWRVLAGGVRPVARADSWQRTWRRAVTRPRNLEDRRTGGGGGWPGALRTSPPGSTCWQPLPVGTSRVAVVGHSAGSHLGVWAAGAGRAARGGRPVPPQTRRRDRSGRAGRTCSRSRTARATGSMWMRRSVSWAAGPRNCPRPYGWPIRWHLTAGPRERRCACIRARDQRVPYAYSERNAPHLAAAGGAASLVETFGDHFSLIDPASRDWAAALGALADLLAQG